ncbi:ubiquitin carboxyl-terminal hydrolase 5-like [Liolophura sinensis]|uniref:ubiquitin carboxyl-terminal hydrolase 5-like n=1 Tax=Liolophura sinensis TaxID=3198878 RepID=UPI003159520C
MLANLLNPHLPKIRVPQGGQKVYKDECAYSFDTPESENGLYICMSTFLGLGKKHVERHYRKTASSCAVYLRIKRVRKEIPQSEEDKESKPTKLAIGIEGGFSVEEKKFKFEETTSIVVLPDWKEIPLPCDELPDIVALSVAGILGAEDAWKLEEAAAMAGTWDGEKRIISKYAESLQQLDNGKKIPPTGWKCEQCDLTSNLWLNLTDGSILCGRKFFDGSGGNNHALEAYAKTKYPLAVKLGTITPNGADVFSYDEDDMVEDPFLAKHLAHWGINIAAMQKTEKTMIEMEIDLNQKVGEWDVIQEAGNKLIPVYGPGLTGIRNLGNSCYMNSVMQILFTVPDFQKRYAEAAERIFDDAPSDPTSDFNTQMAKFGHGLLSGDYSQPIPEGTEDKVQAPRGIRPQMFKSLIGRGHPEFSTKRQQDAQEFLLHIINVIERNSRGTENPTDSFKYEVEERVQCGGSSKVRYSKRSEYLLSLNIPLEAAVNKDEVLAYEAKKQQLAVESKKIDPSEIVRPQIPLQSCIESFAATVIIDDFYSSALQSKCKAQQTTRLSTFPDFLVIQLKKFTIGEDWVPKKLDVSVDVPDTLDLSPLRGQGMQPGEEELPTEQTDEPEIQIDESVVTQLTEMGFAREGCRKAVYHTKNTGVEAAMNWVMEHMGDPDFEVPLQLPKKSKDSFSPNEEAVAMIVSMGFTIEQASMALKATDNNVERAADWIFSHADELTQPMETESTGANEQAPKFRDGHGKYRLVGFISHMGTSSLVGHYVCHILKDGQWVIFNDEKVALSVNPPKDLGYLYLYQREE